MSVNINVLVLWYFLFINSLLIYDGISVGKSVKMQISNLVINCFLCIQSFVISWINVSSPSHQVRRDIQVYDEIVGKHIQDNKHRSKNNIQKRSKSSHNNYINSTPEWLKLIPVHKQKVKKFVHNMQCLLDIFV